MKISYSNTKKVDIFSSLLMLQRKKATSDVFWDLNITFKYLVCLKRKTVSSHVLSLNLKLFRTTVDIKDVIRDYSLRNYVVNACLIF